MQTKLPKVFIIVLNFNGEDKVLNCLTSIFQSDYENFEVVLVDNNSTDGSFEKAKLQYSRVHFIRSAVNVGFAKGNNIGIRWALEKFADHIFILNNDTVIERDTLSVLVAAMKKIGNTAIISPLIMEANKKDIWFAGGTIDWLRMRTHHINKLLSNELFPSQYLSGCAMLINKHVFKEIGLLDERYFLYYEDADFSYRANKAGFGLYVAPASKIIHLEQSNTLNEAKLYWLVLSGLIFFRTHGSLFQKLWTRIYICLRKIKNLYDTRYLKKGTAIQVARAYKDFNTLYR